MQLRHALLFLVIGFVGLAVWQKRIEKNAQARNPMDTALTKPRQFPAKLIVKASTPTNSLTGNSFRQLLDNDRFCEIAQLTKNMDRDLTAQFLESLGLQNDSELSELAALDGPYLGNVFGKHYVTKTARLIQALKLSGDFGKPSKGTLRDPMAAWILLTQLHNEDPFNAAYLFFRLGIEQDQDYPLEQRLATVSDLLQAKEFQSDSVALYREIVRRMTQNASKFLAGAVVVGQLPTPDYGRGRVALRELEFERPGLSALVGRLMMAEALNARDSFKVGGYSVSEYFVGKSLVGDRTALSLEDLDRNKKGPRGDLAAPLTGECTESTHRQFLADMGEF